MKISKTTQKFAAKRNLEIVVDESEHGLERFCIFILGGECEWLCDYIESDNGNVMFGGNMNLPEDIKEELPAQIRDEKHFREVLEFIAKEGANSKAFRRMEDLVAKYAA